MGHRTRARQKLEEIRNGRSNDEQVSRTPVEIFTGMMLAALFAVPPLLAGVLHFSGRIDTGPVTAVLLMLFSMFLFTAILYFFLRNSPTTPELAVGLFMRRIATRNYAGAWTMVVNGDKDDTTRRVGDAAFTFETMKGFGAYWDKVLDGLDPSIQSGHVYIGQGAVHRIGPDLATVTFHLAGPEGARGHAHTKLVVRLEDEWRIFNGALDEEEENDTAWAGAEEIEKAHGRSIEAAPAAAAWLGAPQDQLHGRV